MKDNSAGREFIVKYFKESDIIKYFEKIIKEFDKILEKEKVNWFEEKTTTYADIRDFELDWCNNISYDILKPQYNCCLDKLIYNVDSGWEYRKVDNRNLYGGGA